MSSVVMIRDYLKKSGFFVLVARDGTKSFLFEIQIKNAPLWIGFNIKKVSGILKSIA